MNPFRCPHYTSFEIEIVDLFISVTVEDDASQHGLDDPSKSFKSSPAKLDAGDGVNSCVGSTVSVLSRLSTAGS